MKIWGLRFAHLSNGSANGTSLGLLRGLIETPKTLEADTGAVWPLSGTWMSQRDLVSTGQLLKRTTTLPILSPRANTMLMVVQRPLDRVMDVRTPWIVEPALKLEMPLPAFAAWLLGTKTAGDTQRLSCRPKE